MAEDSALVKYFIEHTNSRLAHMEEQNRQNFEKLDSKITEVLQFKWQIIGGATILSALVSIAIAVLFESK
jgi:hypothetical protein